MDVRPRSGEPCTSTTSDDEVMNYTATWPPLIPKRAYQDTPIQTAAST